jgi:hypothetical protein
MNNTNPVKFNNNDGQKLFGILHGAIGTDNGDIGIIILSPGVKSRVAPHRLYLKMARRYSELGFNVFRFDFYGLGDSEGEIEEEYLADFYGSVQVGRYYKDTISAMDWMEKECNTSRFILAGLCGGAITGLFAGAKDKRVIGLLGLGIPVILDSSNTQHERYLTDGRLENIMATRYFPNLFKWEKWFRFLTFRSDYKLILQGFVHTLKKKINNTEKVLDEKNKYRESLQNTHGNFNWHFPGALKHMLSDTKKVFLIFSESDRLYLEFNEKYFDCFGREIKEHESMLKVDVVKNANHIFSFKEWQEDMLQISLQWLKKNYCADI